ncbi:Rab-like protein 2A [Triplophysa tibetana]|uniref:Rab-like protein 2A n=1 Tax=Triplophysa tibetana TaxID=1572043 RepID=A0A5A9NZQ6_9TELE|nr:Rab-like protein 2A [Triplophysa tibetana]
MFLSMIFGGGSGFEETALQMGHSRNPLRLQKASSIIVLSLLRFGSLFFDALFDFCGKEDKEKRGSVCILRMEAGGISDLDQEKYDADEHVKIICLGDSAVGKSNRPQQLSTYALTLYKYTTTVNGKTILVDFWDTAGQERFRSMHPSYYHKAHACIMVFDVHRKITYKNLPIWYKELREYRPEIPCLVVANKIDADMKVTQKSFNFAKKQGLPFYFVSAADGTNVVKVFKDAIQMSLSYKKNSNDFMDEVMRELENFDLESKEELSDKEEETQEVNTESA